MTAPLDDPEPPREAESRRSKGEKDSATALKAAGATPLIAFGSHIHAARLEEARAAGADEAIPNSRFESRLRELLKE